MLKERLGTALPRSTLVRVDSAAQGNPLFALEIGLVGVREGIHPGHVGERLQLRLAFVDELSGDLLRNGHQLAPRIAIAQALRAD